LDSLLRLDEAGKRFRLNVASKQTYTASIEFAKVQRRIRSLVFRACHYSRYHARTGGEPDIENTTSSFGASQEYEFGFRCHLNRHKQSRYFPFTSLTLQSG